jgi:branched-subunit amino acid permease
MESFFPVAIVGAMIAAVGALLLGIVSMAKGGEFNRKYGNKLCARASGCRAWPSCSSSSSC